MLLSAKNFRITITTPRLILGTPNESSNHINEYIEAINESIPEINQWLPWAKYTPSTMQTKEYIKLCNKNWLEKSNSNLDLVLWIMSKTTSKFLGSITIWNILWDIPKIEFGYWLRSSQTGNGYVTEAVNALTRYSLEQLGINRIEIRCEKENIRSQLIPQRLAFNFDGIFKNGARAISTNKLTDIVIYSRTDTHKLPALKITQPSYFLHS